MIILFILIFFYIILLLQKNKKQNIINTQRLTINNNLQKIMDIVVLIFFFLLYIVLFRFIKLFSNVKIINIYYFYLNIKIYFKYLIGNYNFILIIILILLIITFFFLIKTIIIQNIKISFIRLNYYYASFSEKYFSIYITLSCWQSFFWYWITITKLKLNKKNEGIFFYKKNKLYLTRIYYFFKYIGIIILFLLFLFDIIINNNYLIYCSKFLPYFGLYQTLYLINKFFTYKLKPRQDSYCCDYLYFPPKYNIQKIDYKVVLEITQYLESLFK